MKPAQPKSVCPQLSAGHGRSASLNEKCSLGHNEETRREWITKRRKRGGPFSLFFTKTHHLSLCVPPTMPGKINTRENNQWRLEEERGTADTKLLSFLRKVIKVLESRYRIQKGGGSNSKPQAEHP